ncbi:nucleotidyl transferase AbiEii/AbiGii toxin family protein [Marinobacter sp. 71-i]|uniref:Nucleotidyl transferase AbiEii/AbiGii toxin family protein n=1 Tax=Marinobacter iranensis TaxID=2962607 RepID=A0ABT5YAJ5_9GAMM|nr:nucleotidyl transferase AbiEii/AbiGii toxin family protein [Marinobacter iranensis]MDF0750712.1 nucleotidyl transferase AbiEii/AbiGii toxin family protein [Marinobacter iranensis]
MSLDKDVAEYLSREEGIDPAFIEKDWHAVRVLEALSGHSHEGITTIFTGGTSLSNGHGLLKRFSEDLDFRARIEGTHSASQLKKQKSSFRKGVIGVLREIEGISFGDGDIVVDGLGFKIQLAYPKEFETPQGIRPELQIEFSYTQPRLDPKHRPIASMIARYKDDPDETGFLCLSPVEIAADKFSSLVWRVHKRDREDEKDDPAMLRHLHDLSALKDMVEEDNALFVATTLDSFATDQERLNRRVSMALKDAALKASTIMQSDALYREEYQQFVDAMSYAPDDERIDFAQALDNFQKLANLLDA